MPHDEVSLALNLGFIVITAALFAFLGKLIRMPSIVAYIVAGIVLGPALHLVEIDHSLELITELGIALLLFLVGLELSLDKIKNLGKVAIILGGAQVAITATGGFLLAAYLRFGLFEAIFLACTVTFSSTVVVIKLLDQKGAMDRLYARLSIALFLAQDIVVIILLTVLSGIGGGENLELWTILKNLALAFSGMAVLLAVVLIAARYLLPKPFAWAARSPETIFIWALCWCFLIVLLAHQFHLSVEIGAFLAGIAVAQLPMHEDLHRRLHPLMTFFIAIFLVTLGIKMEFSNFNSIIGPALAMSAFVLLLKPLIVFLIVSRLKFSEYTAFQTAIATGQVSEFAFILLAMAAAADLIPSTTVSIGGLIGLITIAVSAYLINYSEPLYNYLHKIGILKYLRARQEPDPEDTKTREDHIIVVGMNALGRAIVTRLAAQGETVLAIDTDPKKLENLQPAETVLGNVEYQSVVEEIGLRKAKMLVSALQIEDFNHLLAYRCRSAGIPCAIHAFDMSIVEDLLDLETAYLLMPAIDGAVEQRELMEQEGLLHTP